MDVKREVRKRTLSDKVISNLNSLRYAVTEPLKLRKERAQYGHLYGDIDEKPLVSVYINTLNRAQILIERAVPSVLSQTYQNLELLVVGNHCTDNTEELLSKIDDPRLRFCNLPSRKRRHPDDIEIYWLLGGSAAANKGLDMLKGKWIAWLGDDDVWAPDYIEKLLHFAQKEKYEFVSAQYIEKRFGKEKVVDGERANGPYHTRKPADPNDDSPKIGGIQTWLYRSYLRFFKFNQNCWRKGWNRPVDVDLYLRMYHAGVNMGYLEEVVAYVLPRPGEETVGLDAYKLTEKEKLAQFRQSNEN